jgi:Ankyrin repeat
MDVLSRVIDLISPPQVLVFYRSGWAFFGPLHVQFLLLGIAINMQPDRERQALMVACVQDGYTALNRAAYGGHAHVVACLLEAPGINVNVANKVIAPGKSVMDWCHVLIAPGKSVMD